MTAPAPERLTRLRRTNALLGLLHAAQEVAVLARWIEYSSAHQWTVMWLQYRQKGKWADYVFGERVYMGLSLVAKSLLAWQVFAGTLAS